jgi:ATP-dependent RNA helicase DHX36
MIVWHSSLFVYIQVYVIDCGKAKLPNFDPQTKLNTLNSEWITLANGSQRKGRAGRTKPGICYKLYSRGRESTFPPHPIPEIKRTRLEELILRVKILKLGRVEDFLRKVPEPPDDCTVKISLELLHELGALDDAECLTPLGLHLAQLPTDPRTGKLILLGAIFGCLEPMLSIAAALNFKDPFVVPLHQEENYRKRKKVLGDKLFSDHLLIAKVMRQFRAAQNEGYATAKAYCIENFLSTSTMSMLSNMMDQFCRDLHERQFVTSVSLSDPAANVNSKNDCLVLAVLCAGLFPNVANVAVPSRNLPKRNSSKSPTSAFKVMTPEDGPVLIHPRSINYNTDFAKSTWLCYYDKVKSTSVYLHDCSVVPPLAVLFFGGEQLLGKKNGKINSNGFRFKWDSLALEKTQSLRLCWENYLCHRVSHPGATDWSPDSMDSALLRAIIQFTTATSVSLDEETGFLMLTKEEAGYSRVW